MQQEQEHIPTQEWDERTQTYRPTWYGLKQEARAAYIQAASAMPNTTRPLGIKKPGSDINRVVRKAKQLFEAAYA